MATKVEVIRDGAKLYATVTVPPGKEIHASDIQRRATGAVTAWVKRHQPITATRRQHGEDVATHTREFKDGTRTVTYFYRIKAV